MNLPSDTARMRMSLHLADEAATRTLGAQLAATLMPGMRIHLRGELGSGKTTLVRALLRALGWSGRVKSPTYTLVELYEFSSLYFYHFDLYRFRDPREWDEAGFREFFNDHSVCVVEWPEKAAGLLPPPDLEIALRHAAGGESRQADISILSDTGTRCASALKSSANSC